MEACLTQQRSYNPIQPQRGAILDCRGRILAASDKIQRVFAEPRVIEEPKETSTELAEVLDMGAHVICQLITDSNNAGYARIKDDVSREECELVLGQCAGRKRIHRGVGVESVWRRNYPTGRLFSSVVGFTSKVENRGLEGIEYLYDEDLRGSAVENIFLADVVRRPIRLAEQNGMLTDGTGLILTLDATIQQFTRDELLKRYEEYQAESAVAVVADPKTGAILAMVSVPDFDPGGPRGSDPNFWRNRTITDTFEPGSILKPIAAAVALDAGLVNTYEKIFCENGYYRGHGFGGIGEYRLGFGDLTVREILTKSSNIGMAKIGQRLGAERLYGGLRLFGFGRKSGIELPGEADGTLHPAEKWDGYSVTRVPFGQEISVTSIQLVRAFCILANGGRLIRPYLVKAMVGPDGRVVELRQPVPPVGYVVKPEVARWVVTEALVGVVNEGTGKRAKLEKWQVFGKTGTANVALSDGLGYAPNAYVASFIAGAPAEDPAVVVLVSVRKPKRSLGIGYTGGVVASPVAAKIIEKTLTYLEKQKG
jgi:cell division protein FtsI/penicillin-binding protein 2